MQKTHPARSTWFISNSISLMPQLFNACAWCRRFPSHNAQQQPCSFVLQTMTRHRINTQPPCSSMGLMIHIRSHIRVSIHVLQQMHPARSALPTFDLFYSCLCFSIQVQVACHAIRIRSHISHWRLPSCQRQCIAAVLTLRFAACK